MKLDIGFYATRDGRKIHIVGKRTDGLTTFVWIGYAFGSDCAAPGVWRNDGSHDSGIKGLNIVGPWVEPKIKKKVASFVFRHRSILCFSNFLDTETEAQTYCKNNGHELIKWPYGEIIEIEE